MAQKNRYLFRGRISERKFRDLLRLFALDITADRAAALTGLNHKTAAAIFHLLRLRMAELAQAMVHGALDALVAKDVKKAEEILESDDKVDKLNEQIFRELITYIIEDSNAARRAISLLFVSKYLERIGDHATNIAEMVIFWAEGQDIRHGAGANRE